MQVDIITPEKTVFSGEAISAVLPAWKGEMEVLNGHIPYIAVLKKGKIKVNTETGMNVFSVQEGYARVTRDSIRILTKTIELL